MVQTNDNTNTVHASHLEEFSYFNNDFFSYSNVQSPNFSNETSLIETINSIINFDSNDQPPSHSHPSNSDVNISSQNSRRESSVGSEIWDHQNVLERKHPSITTIDSNNETKFEVTTGYQNFNDHHVNFDIGVGEIVEPKEKVHGVSDNNLDQLHSFVNQQMLNNNFPSSLADFSGQDLVSTSVNPDLLSTSHNRSTGKIAKTFVKDKAVNRVRLLDGLQSSPSSMDEIDRKVSNFTKFDDRVHKDEFDTIFSNSMNFEDYDLCSNWVAKPKIAEIPTENSCNFSSDPTESLKTGVLLENNTDSENDDYKQQITETSDWLDVKAQRIYEASSDEEDADNNTDVNDFPNNVLPKELPPYDDLPKLDQAKHRCDGCFKVNRVSYGCSKQLVERLPNIDAFKEYNSPNKYTLKFAIQEGSPEYCYVNSEVNTRYDPSIKRYSTKILYSSKGKKLKRDYPSLCPFCKVSESKSFDSLFYERNNSCYRGHLINTHGINSTGERAKLPKSGFVCYKLGKNSWSETVGFKCPYKDCNQCFLKGDKTHGFHEYIRHWNRCHISVDK